MDNLNALYDLYKALKAARTKRGVMDFDRITTREINRITTLHRIYIKCCALFYIVGYISNCHYQFPAVMFSHARLTYTKVGKILEDHDSELTQQYSGVMDNLNALYDLYKALKAARTKRGVMDFDRIIGTTRRGK
jgi:exoribonuclease R